ncbi:MAG TPA: BTAD domain-containing putative transcriptional regulator [Gaiellaceae bacterium]|nr:BTAD domain-containing putative transcriptional regulator [Gaiellaceae bacterium]
MIAPELGLLRGFEVRVGGRPVDLPISVQRVVAFLALHERPLQRLYIAGNLWLDSSEERANASLRTALWRLGRQGSPLVLVSGTQVSLSPEVVVDLLEVRRQAQRVLRRETSLLTDVDDLCVAGELLPDWYDDWVLIERERFRQLRLHALDTLCEELTAAGRYGAAIEAGHASVASEPLRESAHRLLVAAYLAEGNIGEAIRQYRFFRELLRNELGLDPSPQMELLVTGLPIQ